MVELEKNITRYSASDFIFLSFPKSGRTWIRYFIAKYIELEFQKEFTLEIEEINNIPRIIFSHNYFDTKQDIEEEPEIILQNLLKQKEIFIVVRDPRDVAVSYYHQKVNREERLKKMDINEFVFSPIYGIERQAKFVLKLLDLSKEHARSKLVVYENLLRQPETYFYRIIYEIFKEVNNTNFYRALNESTFEKMKEYELTISKQGVGDFSRIGKKNWNGDNNSLKVRRGKLNSYLSELTPESIERLNKLPFTSQLIYQLADIKS